MSDTQLYAVFLFPQAVEAAGEVLKPHLREGPAGTHIVCRQVDTGGTWFQMLIPGQAPNGHEVELEVMIPHGYVRVVMSVRDDPEIGFV
jgi:hypothetical protein